jgi:hypothetical protein
VTNDERKKRLEARLLSIHKRMQWIADTEMRAAWLNGAAARGEYLNEKERLIEETDRVVDELTSKPDA